MAEPNNTTTDSWTRFLLRPWTRFLERLRERESDRLRGAREREALAYMQATPTPVADEIRKATGEFEADRAKYEQKLREVKLLEERALGQLVGTVRALLKTRVGAGVTEVTWEDLAVTLATYEKASVDVADVLRGWGDIRAIAEADLREERSRMQIIAELERRDPR